MANIKEKIQKLLALSQSSNENEARDALLKARELMVKNKLTEADFDVKEAKMVHLLCEDVKWTTDSGNIWMVDLCRVIADNYVCSVAWSTHRGKRTHTLIITGLEDDADLCKEVIGYAIGFMANAIKILERRSGQDYKTVAQSYAKGFILGLELAFDEQKEEHPEWGLVVVKPKEVQEYEDSLGHKDVRTRQAKFDPLAYMKGQNDGRTFNAKQVIGCQ